ncbi:hypothetical protein EVAR_54330_1 [Eumeta japonica]|uniref:Uncharacterized protein n=1 Tax=Eumeta variegata TaxID=151549 RepID=A0A4C1Y8F1_EUMVA|nr:hypothetical protein EVAR_54330_1 [Eumeta japonica]
MPSVSAVNAVYRLQSTAVDIQNDSSYYYAKRSVQIEFFSGIIISTKNNRNIIRLCGCSIQFLVLPFPLRSRKVAASVDPTVTLYAALNFL